MLGVDAYFELLALNRALMEVRFLGGDIDDAVRGSSHLADIHARLLEEIIAYHRQREELAKVASWQDWLVFGNRTLERRGIVEYLSEFWSSWDSKEARRAALETQMKPFVYSQEDFDSLYRELEERSLPR
ncbi:hypothetical protein [Nucisporomicrobium flavum]|uniref:hypothetical protein n=1 Tax=Nucisporomicrobium flavum TaxID=2785915 RepID=UPI0018F69E38|nr:hypothetical protein [Nucisporomicrobium flavum]